jgi:hypothetical protein
MDLSRELHLIACLFAAAALWNLAFGRKSWRGRRLYRRMGLVWKIVRWTGIALFVGYMLRPILNWEISVYVGLLGGFLMLIGTSLTRSGED